MKKTVYFISALFAGAGVFIYSLVSLPPSSPDMHVNVFLHLPQNHVSDSIQDSCRFFFINYLEFPETKPNDAIISHSGYSFLYNDAHKQSDWVAYLLTSERLNNPATSRPKNKKFTIDKAVSTGTAAHDDYTNSKFDRGHLAPCADMLWSEIAMNESFFMSNVSPQTPEFNQQTWEKLEELVRHWAKQYDTLYIATGPLLHEELPFLIDVVTEPKFAPKKNVSVPEYFYKVILNYTSQDIKGIGFIMPNIDGMGKSIDTVKKYAVSIDSVEKFTGINFFYQLTPAQQECAEKTFDVSKWDWK